MVSEKGWQRLKQKLKSLTRKTNAKSFDERVQQVKEVQTGWINYFRMASIQGKLKDLDSCLRNRLRYCIWKDWKKPERKRKNLLRLGIDQDMHTLGAEQEWEDRLSSKPYFKNNYND